MAVFQPVLDVFALFAALNPVQKETKGPLWQHVNVSLNYKNSPHENTKSEASIKKRKRVKPVCILVANLSVEM